MAGELTVQTSPVGRFIDALCDRLSLRTELEGVPLYSASVTEAEAPTQWFETVQIWDASETQVPGAMGRQRRNHEWQVRGVVMAIRTGDSIEGNIRAARSRVFELLAVVESELRATDLGAMMAGLSGDPTSRLSQFRSLDFDQGSDPQRGRWATAVWTIGSVASTVTVG